MEFFFLNDVHVGHGGARRLATFCAQVWRIASMAYWLSSNGGNESNRSGGNQSNRSGGERWDGWTGWTEWQHDAGDVGWGEGWNASAAWTGEAGSEEARDWDREAREVAPTEPTSEGTGPSAVAGNPAVAANPEVHPAVAAALGAQQRRIFDLAYFRSFTDFTSGYKQHNVALKWFRDSCELAGRHELIFSNTAVAEVAQITHPKGMQYSFDESIKHPWRWQEMVALLDDDSMRIVVEGPTHIPARGLVSCKIEESDIYDHKRHVAGRTAVADRGLLKVWNFVLERDDGTRVSLHPNWSNTKVQCSYGLTGTDHELPRSGKGGTSGPGTYKYFKDKHTHATLRFDATKFRVGTTAVAEEGTGTPRVTARIRV